MASETTLLRLQAEFDNPPEFLLAATALLESGATPDFICHYRRDETGDMGDVRVFEIAERLHFLEDLETRKQAIRDQAKERNKLDADLEKTLADCFDQDLLDDIYQTFRPSRRTPGVQAREKGLGELADKILAGQMGEQTLPDAADALISAEKDLPTREAVLEGVLHILAEGWAQDPVLRSRFRRELAAGLLKSEAGPAASGKGGGKALGRYKPYFEFEQPVRRVQGNDLLTIWRGEREGMLKVSLGLAPDLGKDLVRKHARIETGTDEVLVQVLDFVYQHTADNLLMPACESDVRHQIKERVDRTTAHNLARNLRSQLMAPPLGNKRTLGVRASKNTVWLALLDQDSSLLKHLTLSLETDEKRAESIATLSELIETEKPEGIAIPHGRHQDVTAAVVKDACAKVTTPIVIVPVDEAASAVHATSSSARKEWPGLEVGVRTAISLANRLQDSMHELLSLDPKALGLGHTLDEVHQGILTRILDQTIASCVAKIGMDVNRAGISHLSRVPGMTRDMAKRIFDHRKKNGSFKTLAELRENELLNEEEARQVCGFLRVWGGTQPIDATGIHPDDYGCVERIATAEGSDVASLLGKRVRTPAAELIDENAGALRIRDIMAEIVHYGEDVRGTLTAVQNEGIRSLEDLRPDMELKGRVTNLTEFGAFIDLGIHQDGLVHISQIPGHRLRDPNKMLAVGEVIKVFVLKVDPEQKRISLSMHQPRHVAEGRQPTIGERMQSGGGRGGRRGGRKDAPTEPLTRAARAPEGRRRGGMRQGPRPAGGGGPSRSPFGGGGRDRDRGGRGGGRGGTPRVVTVESERPIEEARGHKGELTSFSSLANLLGGKPSGSTETPAKPTSESPAETAPAPKQPDAPAPAPAPAAETPSESTPATPSPSTPSSSAEAPSTQAPNTQAPAESQPSTPDPKAETAESAAGSGAESNPPVEAAESASDTEGTAKPNETGS